MPQTSYLRSFNDVSAGQPYDGGVSRKGSKTNSSGSDIPSGVAVKANGGGKMTVLAAASDVVVGVILNDYARDPDSLTGSNAVKNTASAPLMEEGAVVVQIDQDVNDGDPVFVRFATGGAGAGGVGSFRKDADGVAQVSTGTPTAVNSTIYVLRVEVTAKDGKRYTWSFEYISDGSATATEIVTGFKTLMAADTAFAALVAATGTSTLVLTTVDTTGSVTFVVASEGDGAISWAATTPAGAHARVMHGAYWLDNGGTAANGYAPLYFSKAAQF